MFTDSHCHLASHKFSENEVKEILARAKTAGINRFITLGTDLEDLATNLALTKQHESIFCSLGIHPCDVTETPDNYLETLEPNFSDPKVVAVGESGLDYFHPAPEGWSTEDYHARQRKFLDQHFQLAERTKRNIVLHTRDRSGAASFDDCLEIYKRYSSQVRAVFHCFPGTLPQAEQVLDLGGLVSFTGNVTFKNAHQIQETASKLPLGSFMLETDSPYLAPTPYRGKRNEPAYIKEIAYHICTLKKIAPEELSKATEEAVNRFFFHS